MRPNRAVPRRYLRFAHLAEAVVLLAYFYGPLAGAPALGALLRFAVLPALVTSGLVMWLQPRVLRWRNRRARGADGVAAVVR